MEWARKVNGRIDGRTDGGHDIIRPVLDARIEKGVKVDFSSYCTSCTWFISSRQAHILNEYFMSTLVVYKFILFLLCFTEFGG